MNIRKLGVIIFLSLLMMIPSSAKLTTKSTSNGMGLRIVIGETFYTDLDGDGLDMDVYSQVVLHLSGGNRYNMEYYITLTLPSGVSDTYAYQINTRLSMIHLDNYFYNHALEMGDYSIKVEVVLKTGGLSYSTQSLVFDPPGGEQRPPKYFELSAW